MKMIGMISALGLFTIQLLGPVGVAAQGNPLQVRLGSHLIGSTVKNPQGKDLGSIKDLVISPEENRVLYAVLSFGGVLGLGEKFFAMPLSALKPAAEAKTFVLEMDPERLRNAPEFNQNNWPQMTDPQWITSVYTFYGLQPDWQH
jgi:PRC-barrel domain